MDDTTNAGSFISVGYRVNSIRATQFRRWATQVLSQYTQKGYVIDRKRMEKYRFIQDQLYESDFDKLVMNAKK